MSTVKVNIINAFIDSGAGGNPAGVVINADSLDQSTKQKIAAKVGFSETAFVSSSNVADYKLEFFTPTRQIAHCGHATIATFSYLAQQKIVKGTHTSKETIDGRREIFLDGEVAYMQQLAPKYFSLDKISKENIIDSLGIHEPELISGQEPIIVNTGNSFMIIPIKDEGTLKSLKPNFRVIEQISERFDLIGYYAFTLQTAVAGRDAATRMFAPRYGIQEESATGMAAGPLACYLYDQLNIKKQKMIIEQGRLMLQASPSEILVEFTLEDGRITQLIAGGRAKVMQTFDMEI